MSEYIYKPPKSLSPGSIVIAYLRDSGGPKQEESIGQQERAITEYCRQYNLILQKIYSDTASGRKTKNRDQFIQMFNDVMALHEDLRPSGLLLWSFSRFSRDVFDFNYFFYGLVRQGLTIHSLTEEIPDGLAGGVVLSVKAYSNADYSIQLSKSIKRGIADRVKEGFNNGGQAPRGYKVVRIYQDSQRANGVKRVGIRWEPDPELAPLVVLAWQMRAQGKGYAEITQATGGKIYKTKNSWGTHFRNKSYLGIGKAGGIEIPDHHTPIITWELWEAVKRVEAAMPSQATRGAQGNPYHPRRLRHPSLLSGLSFCIYCGAAMVLHTARDYRSYQCGKRDRQRAIKDCTQARSVNARIADRVILDTVLKRILSPTFVESLLAEIQSQMVDTGKIDQEISNTNALLVSTERSISRLLSLAEESGEIKEIAIRLKQLRQERAEYNARIIQLKATRAVDVPDISLEALSVVFSVWRKQIETAIQSGDILTAKRLLAQFVSKIELSREKAVIHYTFPLGIPSDGGSGLSAHKSPAQPGLFVSLQVHLDGRKSSGNRRRGQSEFCRAEIAKTIGTLLNLYQNGESRVLLIALPYNGHPPLRSGKGLPVSIRFKVILPYLLLTLIVAVTGAYVVTRLVSSSLSERLANQLVEAGRVVSDSMARQEIRHLESARVIAYTRGLGAAIQAGDAEDVAALARPVTGGLNVESLLVFDTAGGESLHLIKQSNGTIMDVSQPGQPSTLAIVESLLAENNPGSLPKRELALDPVDGRYYYFTAVPIVTENQVVGAAVVGTSLNTVLINLKSTSLADVIVYGENGQALASSLGSGTEALFLRTISIPPELYREILQQDHTVQGEHLMADDRSYSLARGPLKVGGDRIAVFAVVLPRDFVVLSGSVNRNIYVALYSLAMLAVILIGYFVTRLIINPLSRLVRTSLAIAGGDLTRRTEIESKDEIGVLAHTFDEMTDHLQQRTLELEKTNRLLEQMDQTKMRFIHVAAHELRTPLTFIRGYGQMIQIRSQGNAEFQKYSSGILDGSDRMVEIIDNMLDVSRIDTNQLELMPAEMEIQPLLEKISSTFEAALLERNISLRSTGLADLPAIIGDKDHLYKVFYHVIGNAIKYTPDGGRVTVAGRLLNDEVEITVRDTGIGIAPENQELVFKKFYQTGEVLLHSSGKTKFKGGGPGLGLAIARGIVDAHCGRIWLESPGYDEEANPGTTVFVRLPVDGPRHERS